MSKKIKLYWYQHREGHGNFGDELNPYIIERLTGSEIQWTSAYNGSRWNSLRTLAYLILKESPISFRGFQHRLCMSCHQSLHSAQLCYRQ